MIKSHLMYELNCKITFLWWNKYRKTVWEEKKITKRSWHNMLHKKSIYEKQEGLKG